MSAQGLSNLRTGEGTPAPISTPPSSQRHCECERGQAFRPLHLLEPSERCHASEAGGCTVTAAEYIGLFVLVALMGAGLPGPGDAALIAAGTAAGEGRLNLGIILVVAAGAWMIGSVIGYEIGHRGGRPLLEHPGRLEKNRHHLLAKGDQAFGRHDFTASATLPAFLSGIFRVRFRLFMLGAVAAGAFWIGLYVVVSYYLGADLARAIGNAGTKALLGVVVVVGVGLTIRFGWAKWRDRRRAEAA